MARILIFTGKGGVGKSSVAAAHARKSAWEGKKTLLLSTDMAHNLGDILERKIGREVVKAAENLDVVELDPNYIMEHDFSDLMQAVQKMITSKGMGDFQGDALVMMPGMEELFSLLKILEFYEKGDYERIIVDCAPTGETLSLLKFPELLSWYMEKFFPLGKAAVRILSPASKAFLKIELPDKKAMSDIERLYVRLNELQKLLKNEQITSIRLVALPEKMVVEETKRNYMYMNLYGYCVDGVYINRVLKKEASSDFFSEWFLIQNTYIEELENIFSTVSITKIPWYETDICGMEAIDKICEEVLTSPALFSVPSPVENETYEKVENGYLLHLFLPMAQKEQLDMHMSGTDLIIRIGNFKRNIPLPNTLRGYEAVSAKLENQTLLIRFEKNEEACSN